MWANSLKTYGLTLPVLGAGIAVSVQQGDWAWFARSGSAVVAVGIFLTSREILEHNRRLRSSRLRWEARLHGALCDQDWAGEDSLRNLVRSRRRDEEIWETKFHGLYVLVVGTLVWGFGDLVGLLLGP